MDDQQNTNIPNDVQVDGVGNNGDTSNSQSIGASQGDLTGVEKISGTDTDTYTKQHQMPVEPSQPSQNPGQPINTTDLEVDQSQPVHPSSGIDQQPGVVGANISSNTSSQTAVDTQSGLGVSNLGQVDQTANQPLSESMNDISSQPVSPSSVVGPNTGTGITNNQDQHMTMPVESTPMSGGQQVQTSGGSPGNLGQMGQVGQQTTGQPVQQQPQQGMNQQGSTEEKDQNVYNFLVQIIQEKHGNNIPWEQVTAEADRLYDELGDLLVNTFEPEMKENQKEEFDKLYAQGYNQDELQMYLLQNIPNLEDRIQQILIDFRQRYLSN